MSDDNLYAAPQAELTVAEEGVEELASRGRRFAAAILDTVVALVILMPAMWFSGYFEEISQQDVDWQLQIAWGLVGFIAFVLIHGYLLATQGQTIGKRLVGIRIVAADDGSRLSLAKLIGMRYLPITVVGQIPLLGNILALINVLFIFRKDRRCVHDHIAGSKVVVVPKAN